VKVRKVVRRVHGGHVVSALNVVVASNVGEPGGTVSASSRQHVEIIQQNGHTQVRDHRPTDNRPRDPRPNDKES